MGKHIVEAFCPICGHGIGEKRAAHMIDLLTNKKYFGVLRPTGYGGFKNSEYIEPNDSPDLYGKIRNLFLGAIKTWLKNGWLIKGDLTNLMGKD